MKVDETPSEGYALEGITVKALRDGKDAVSVSCTTGDVNTRRGRGGQGDGRRVTVAKGGP